MSTIPRPFYHRYAWAYDLLIDPPRATQIDGLVALYERHGVRAGSRLVDAGCGTGAWAVELATAGYAVTGIDASPELIEAARAKLPPGEALAFEVGDIATWRPQRPADGVLCRGVLNDLVEDEDRHRCLAALADMLRPEGVAAVDVREWDASAARYAEMPDRERTVASPHGELAFHSHTALEPARRLLVIDERHVLSAAGGEAVAEYRFRMRCWTTEELEAGLREAGFSEVTVGAPDTGWLGVRRDRLAAVAIR